MAAHHRIFILLLAPLFSGACAEVASTELASRAVDAYCPHLPSRTFADPVTVSGQAVYEFRTNGNGAVSDSGVLITIPNFASANLRSYSITVNSKTYTVQSTLGLSAAQQDVAAKLKAALNSDTTAGLYAYGTNSVTVTQPSATTSPTVINPTNLNIATTNASPRPVRLAEVAVKDASGVIVQCAETKDDGTFAFQLAKATGTYTVELRARASNARNSTYILDNPTDNSTYAVSTVVDTTLDTGSVLLRARVHQGLLGGAFNVLDQLLKAQDYLRAQTATCNQPGQPDYFVGCAPFVRAPLVRVYWTPGFSPGVYVNTSGAISFYLTGRYELYLQGGQSGNITSSDMDHFDNSVILHEYAHFLEDAFGRPDSPGGSHNGDSMIDPRLAWGEGWANFFQAAVTGDPIYRDSYGTPDCSSACAGAYFNESLDPSGTPAHDAPTPGAMGEGNFREFSVARLLWDVVKPTGGSSRFSEIWRVFVLAGSGMRAVNDPFKTVGRLHHIQSTQADPIDWASIRQIEEQAPGFSVYATPFALGDPSCMTSPITITPVRRPGDTGSFATSDQLRSNDFYRYDHPGGNVSLELFYSKNPADPIDLDLYLYRTRYLYGRASDMLLSSAFSSDACPGAGGCPAAPAGLSSDYGYEKGAAFLAAGTYMINIQADTSVRAGSSSTYVLQLNGQIACPRP